MINMFKRVFQLQVFAAFSSTLGVILPGMCPWDNFVTNVIRPFPRLSCIISVVPFTEDTGPSYLFRPLPDDSLCQGISIAGSGFEILYAGLDQSHYHYVNSRAKFQRNNTYTMTSQLQNAVGVASDPITENVQVWYPDDVDGIIIWSCKNLDKGEHHDEAMLVAVYSTITERDGNFSDKVANLQNRVKKLVSANLFELILWPNVSQREACVIPEARIVQENIESETTLFLPTYVTSENRLTSERDIAYEVSTKNRRFAVTRFQFRGNCLDREEMSITLVDKSSWKFCRDPSNKGDTFIIFSDDMKTAIIYFCDPKTHSNEKIILSSCNNFEMYLEQISESEIRRLLEYYEHENPQPIFVNINLSEWENWRKRNSKNAIFDGRMASPCNLVKEVIQNASTCHNLNWNLGVILMGVFMVLIIYFLSLILSDVKVAPIQINN